MTKKKRTQKPRPHPPSHREGAAGGPAESPEPLDLDPNVADEDEEIAATRRAIQPLLDAGLSHHRLASAAGAHPEDMRGFVEGRVSLTPMLRERLRSQIPDLLDSLRPRG